jgi:Heavy metal associated domain 2
MTHIVHEIPGRLRIIDHTIKNKRHVAENTCGRLRDIDGVISANANPLTGSLVVRYAADTDTRKRILASLDMEVVQEIVPVRARPMTAGANGLAGFIAEKLVERLAEHAVSLAFAALI